MYIYLCSYYSVLYIYFHFPSTSSSSSSFFAIFFFLFHIHVALFLVVLCNATTPTFGHKDRSQVNDIPRGVCGGHVRTRLYMSAFGFEPFKELYPEHLRFV